MPYTESNYENAIIELFQGMGYTHLYAPDIERDYKIKQNTRWQNEQYL